MADPTPQRTILSPDSFDRLADAVLALTREMWVLRDRQMVMEAVLAARGIDVAAAIDAFVPDDAFQARLDTERDRLIETVAGVLDGRDA
ncbi:MAG: hypothetical protein AB7E60_03180 [Sphingobium sp.]